MIQRLITRLLMARLIPVMFRMIKKAFRKKKPAAAKPQVSVENTQSAARLDNELDGGR